MPATPIPTDALERAITGAATLGRAVEEAATVAAARATAGRTPPAARVAALLAAGQDELEHLALVLDAAAEVAAGEGPAGPHAAAAAAGERLSAALASVLGALSEPDAPGLDEVLRRWLGVALAEAEAALRAL